MKIAICDDEKVLRTQVRELVDGFFAEHNLHCEIDEFETGASFVEKSQEYDLVFLDYQLDDGNGIDFLKQIRRSDTNLSVIFLTSFSEYAIESIKHNVFRYIVKPATKESVYEALEHLTKLYLHNRKIIIPTAEKTCYVDADEVMYIEADKKCTKVVTVNNTYPSRTCISEYHAQINNPHFYRTHRSYIINMRYISSIEKKIVTLTNGDIVFCSPKIYDEFIKNYMNYLKYKT